MSSVTEIVVLEPNADVSADTVSQNVAASVLQQPGALRLRSSKKHEIANHVIFFIDWEDLSAHQYFENSPAYQPFLEGTLQIASVVADIYHVPFEPFPPMVLDNQGGKTAVAEVCHAYLPADISMVQQQEILTTSQQFIDLVKQSAKGLSGETAHGFAQEDIEFQGEKCRALLLILGWDSIEAHMAYRDTEGFAEAIPLLRGMPGLKGIQMFHVRNQVSTK
jgi:quinol monooxygenase YgiN